MLHDRCPVPVSQAIHAHVFDSQLIFRLTVQNSWREDTVPDGFLVGMAIPSTRVYASCRIMYEDALHTCMHAYTQTHTLAFSVQGAVAIGTMAGQLQFSLYSC